MKHYLDTSVVLSALLEHADVLRSLEGEPEVGSSRLLWIEVSSVIYRSLQTARLDPITATEVRHDFAHVAGGIHQIQLLEQVLRRASGPYPLNIRTLDAIHLASAELWLGEDAPSNVAAWSYDKQMNLCAAQLGFTTPLLTTA